MNLTIPRPHYVAALGLALMIWGAVTFWGYVIPGFICLGMAVCMREG